MSFALDFRERAREALRGKWKIAIIVGLFAVLLGGTGERGLEFKVETEQENNSGKVGIEFAENRLYTFGWGENPEMLEKVERSKPYVLGFSVTYGILYFILGSMIEVGYARFNLMLLEGEVPEESPKIAVLFSAFRQGKTAIATRFLTILFEFFWTLLFIIPGIIASYSYAMTGYIQAEHPELTASEVIECSKRIMSGNRWRLFCLHFSFIGWEILCAFTLGIGKLWLVPYEYATEAAFYQEISGRGGDCT